MWQSLFGRSVDSNTRVKAVNAETLYAQLQADENILLVDVRTPGEYEYEGHIPGARLLPLSALSARTEELPRDRAIVCVCRSGARSQSACEYLAAHGFTDVTNLAGGMIGWRRASLPIQ